MRPGYKYLFLATLALLFVLAFGGVATAQTFEGSGADGSSLLAADTGPPPTIVSDQLDYAPGSQVTLAGANWQTDATVHIRVNDDAGQTWSRDVDVDVAADGTIVDSFRLPLWFVATYSVTATGNQSGLTASMSFTDGGDWSIDFVAAEPYSYDHSTGGGAYDDRTIGTDVVESLEGGDFKVGDTVSFLVAVSNNKAAGTGAQTLEMTHTFLLDTTGASGLALGPVLDVKVNYGAIYFTQGDSSTAAIGDGPGHTDAGFKNDDGGSTITDLWQQYPDPTQAPYFQKGGTNTLKYRVTDVEPGETVIVRIDVEIGGKFGSSPTGNLQADFQSAYVVVDGAPASKIPGGAQTIPFKAAGDVIFPGQLIVKKLTDPSGATDSFPFTVTSPGGDLGSAFSQAFSLVDKGSWDSGMIDPSKAQIGNTWYTVAGNYTVTELVPDGWKVQSITATNAGGTDQIVSSTAASATVELDENEVITVVFTDEPTKADLGITKDDSRDPIIYTAKADWDVFSYTLTVTNHSDKTTAKNVVVTDMLDDMVTFEDNVAVERDGTPETASFTGPTAGVLTFDLGAMAPGAVVTITFDVRVKPSTDYMGYFGDGDNYSDASPIPADLQYDLLNLVAVDSDTDDPNAENDKYYEPTGVDVRGNQVLSIVKTTQGWDGAFDDGVTVAYPSTVTWRYQVELVSSAWSLPVYNPKVTDDQGVIPVFSAADSDDTGDTAGAMDPGEVWVYYASGDAVEGDYDNIGSFTATPKADEPGEGNAYLAPVTDPSDYTGVKATVDVSKSADPLTLPEPGGEFSFSSTLKNTSPFPVWIAKVSDSVYGTVYEWDALADPPMDKIVLQPGETSDPFTWKETYTEAGQYPDTVTGFAVDPAGNTVSDKADAQVEVTDVLPRSRSTRCPTREPAEPGGVFTYATW